MEKEITQKQYKEILSKVKLAELTDDIEYAYPGTVSAKYKNNKPYKYYIIFYEPDRKIWEKFIEGNYT